MWEGQSKYFYSRFLKYPLLNVEIYFLVGGPITCPWWVLLLTGFSVVLLSGYILIQQWQLLVYVPHSQGCLSPVRF